MINPAIMQLKMELSKEKRIYAENELKLKRLFWEIQNFANPFYKNLEEIRAEEIHQCAKDMTEIKNLLLKSEKKINKIKNELGEN